MPDPASVSTTVSAEEAAKGERTRLKIIESACALFLAQGFHGTSMRQIAEATELALGSIYNHFATKDEIFVAVLEMYHPWRAIAPAVEAARGETDDDILRDAARRVLSAWSEHSDLVRLHSIEQVEFQGRHLPQMYETTVARIVAAQKSSAARDITISLLERVFFGLFFAYLASEQFTKAALPIDLGQNAVDFFAGAYLEGLLGPAAAAEVKPSKASRAEAKPAVAPSGRKWH